MTTPFYAPTVTYPGADPGVPVYWRVGEKQFWLGQPGNMIQLPSPNPDGYQAPATSGEVVHGLFGGGAALTRFAGSARQWTIGWPRLAGRDWQVVNGFSRRLFGPDPWCFVPPEDVNRLTLAQSMAGDLNDVVEGWYTYGGGTVAFDAVTAPAMQPSGVLRWSNTTSNSYLYAGLPQSVSAFNVDPGAAAPYLPSLPVTVSAYLATASGTSPAYLFVPEYNAAGGYLGAAGIGGTVTLSTTPTLVTATLSAGAAVAGCALLGLGVRSVPASGTAPDLLISCPQLEYGLAASAWTAGGGAPRVLLTAGLNRQLDIHTNSAATMTLTECTTGAA